MSHVHVPAYLNLHCMLIIKTDGKKSTEQFLILQ